MDEELEELLESDRAPEGTKPAKTPELYKKWFKTKAMAGFLSLSPWAEHGLLSVDIGEVKDGSLTGATKSWVQVFKLAPYLDSIVAGPDRSEAFVHYGGSQQGDAPVSRIFKIDPDTSNFLWKTGHFKARRSSTGAFIPDMKSPLSMNLIRVSLVEMREISARLNAAITGWAAADPNWIVRINERDRDE